MKYYTKVMVAALICGIVVVHQSISAMLGVLESASLLFAYDVTLVYTMQWQFVEIYGIIITAIGILLGFSGVCISLIIQYYHNLWRDQRSRLLQYQGLSTKRRREKLIAELQKESDASINRYDAFRGFTKIYLLYHAGALLFGIGFFPSILSTSAPELMFSYGLIIFLFVGSLFGFIALANLTLGIRPSKMSSELARP